MNKEQFETRIKELLPQTTEQALNAWTEYIQSLEKEEIDPASDLFDHVYVELSLIKQHQGEEVATQLFNYGEHFVFNYFELRGAASKLAEGWSLDKICSDTVKNGCDATQEEYEESQAALHAFQQEHAETDDKPADLPESDAPKQMRILVVEPTKDPYVKEIDGSLASMQAIVGGFIQAVEPFDDPNVLLVCNEEAKLLGLPENRFLRNRNGIPYDIIHGTFFLAQGSGEEFCSLTDKQIQTYTRLYSREKLFVMQHGSPWPPAQYHAALGIETASVTGFRFFQSADRSAAARPARTACSDSL
mgnify:FL=1